MIFFEFQGQGVLKGRFQREIGSTIATFSSELACIINVCQNVALSVMRSNVDFVADFFDWGLEYRGALKDKNLKLRHWENLKCP